MKTILHVEDSEADALLFKRASAAAKLPAQLFRVPNGMEAVSYLQGCGQYSDRHSYPVPDLVLLDMEMPKMDGLDLLKWLRGNEKYLRMPVFMLSSCDSEQDVLRAKALGADHFFVKTPLFEDVIAVLKRKVRHAVGPTRPRGQDCNIHVNRPRRYGPQPDLIIRAQEVLSDAESIRLDLRKNRLKNQLFRAWAKTLAASSPFANMPDRADRRAAEFFGVTLANN